MKRSREIVVFTLDAQRFALFLTVVERVVRAVAITPLPKAPVIVPGVINVQGRILPVFNPRLRFRLPEREIDRSDHFIVARTSRRAVALLVDSVQGVTTCPEDETVPGAAILPGLEYVEGVVRRPDGMIFIHDLDQFLSLNEAHQLEEALRHG
jgi:purine-binding chemotaxis protein CheW